MTILFDLLPDFTTKLRLLSLLISILIRSWVGLLLFKPALPDLGPTKQEWCRFEYKERRELALIEWRVLTIVFVSML